MFEIYFIGIWPNFDKLMRIFMNFEGSLLTGLEGGFDRVLIEVLEVKMGQSTQNIFFGRKWKYNPWSTSGAIMKIVWALGAL